MHINIFISFIVVLIIITEKRNDFHKAQDLYNEVLSTREKIKCTVPRRKKRKTLLWKELEKSYHKDLEVTYYQTAILCYISNVSVYRNQNLRNKEK